MVERIYRVQVEPRAGETPAGYLLADIAALGISGVTRVERRALYFLRGELTPDEVQRLCGELLADPVVERATWGPADAPPPAPQGAVRVEVGLLPGVTDSVAGNLLARAGLLGMAGLRAAASAHSYLLWGTVAPEDVQTIARRLLYNDVIEYVQEGALRPHLGDGAPEFEMRAEAIPLEGLDDQALLTLSRERLLSLDLAEMHAVQAYFRGEGRVPTDVELESIAQTWSEHCGHKTFKGIVEYTEVDADGREHQERIEGLIGTYLRAATEAIDAPWVRSAFVDNAGILEFTPEYEVSFKAETHNHPSALEPFGGANTGVGGVVRDIMGVSARPIANTDVLCFGPLDTPLESLPAGVLHPRRIYSGVVAGVEDYGNKMGIPTVNGAICFEPGYTANPLVYCGCVGIAPTGSHPAGARPGDLIVVLGGRTGRDGLHGATFSSIELTDVTGETPAAPADRQPHHRKDDAGRHPGGPRRVSLQRHHRLRRRRPLVGRQRDGQETGVTVHLERVPSSISLQPWEIWLSEAQEAWWAVPPGTRPACGPSATTIPWR